MPSPFPGMDPYLERADLWPDVHNALVTAIRDSLGPRLRPRYFAALEERVYADDGWDLALVGRPDVAVVAADRARAAGGTSPSARAAGTGTAVLEVEVPLPDLVRETYLEVRAAETGEVVTVIEVLSPANKRPGEGQRRYVEKRQAVLGSRTSLVEIDLLRGGERMPVRGADWASDCGILVSRAWRRPRAHLIPFGVRDALPAFPVPLRRDEDEPPVDLGALLALVYDRAGYDLRVDYRRPPQPPLAEADVAWAAGLPRA